MFPLAALVAEAVPQPCGRHQGSDPEQFLPYYMQGAVPLSYQLDDPNLSKIRDGDKKTRRCVCCVCVLYCVCVSCCVCRVCRVCVCAVCVLAVGEVRERQDRDRVAGRQARGQQQAQIAGRCPMSLGIMLHSSLADRKRVYVPCVLQATSSTSWRNRMNPPPRLSSGPTSLPPTRRSTIPLPLPLPLPLISHCPFTGLPLPFTTYRYWSKYDMIEAFEYYAEGAEPDKGAAVRAALVKHQRAVYSALVANAPDFNSSRWVRRCCLPAFPQPSTAFDCPFAAFHCLSTVISPAFSLPVRCPFAAR